MGKTPLIADLKQSKNHCLRIELEGFQPYEVALSKSPSGWVFGNIIFGGIPGLIIDVMTGGMYVLKPEQIQAELRKQNVRLKFKDDQILIAVTMYHDPLWAKVGQLQRVD